MAGEELLDVPRELGGPVDLGRPRRDPLVGEDADGVAQGDLVLGQAVRSGRGCGSVGGVELAIRTDRSSRSRVAPASLGATPSRLAAHVTSGRPRGRGLPSHRGRIMSFTTRSVLVLGGWPVLRS